MVDPTRSRDALRNLLETYNELNSDQIDELYEEPSALEFMRYVASNRPFVVRGGCKTWQAYRQWSAEYLIDAVGDEQVNVAVTPRGYGYIIKTGTPAGNADAIITKEDGSLLFVEPLEEHRRFADALHFIQQQSTTSSSPPDPRTGGPVLYAQTQNDNLRHEYARLFADVPSSISWARIGLQADPDAINLWLGNARSVTSLHKDNYENVYAQIRGQKHFVLLPPCAVACVNEREVQVARYAFVKDGEDELLRPVPEQPERSIPTATWDPDEPGLRSTQLSSMAQPMRVTLEEGDMLYLPAMWYHKVSQTAGDEGFSCAVNYWYDMQFSGGFWATNAFVRDVMLAVR